MLCLHFNGYLTSIFIHLVLCIISFSLWLQVTLFYFATQTSVFGDRCLLSVLGLRSVFCDLSVDKNVILKRVWQNTVWGCRLHLFRLGWGFAVASCENGKENSDSRKGWEFLIRGARYYVRFCSVELVKFYIVINFRDESNGVMKWNLLKNIATAILPVKKKILQLKPVSPIKLRTGCIKALDFA